MDVATSLQAAEQALRDAVVSAMTKKFGRRWMDQVDPAVRDRWAAIRAQEERQRAGHALGGVTDIDYAFLGDLVDLIKRRGHWNEMFEPIFGPQEHAFAMFDLLHRIRRPADHARTLLPFEEDLASGIAGYLRNRVTIYLSAQDVEGDFYPRIERVEDNFGNAWSEPPNPNSNFVELVTTKTTLTVGDEVTLRCRGNDPHGRKLWWSLSPYVLSDRVAGDQADLRHLMSADDTGSDRALTVHLSHDGPYHRNVSGNRGIDHLVMFVYRVIPPRRG